MPKLQVVRWMCVFSAISVLCIATACAQRSQDQVWSNSGYTPDGNYRGTINTLAFR